MTRVPLQPTLISNLLRRPVAVRLRTQATSWAWLPPLWLDGQLMAGHFGTTGHA